MHGEAEEWLRLALDNSAVGMCLVSPEGRFVRVNPALCALLGRDTTELTALTWQEVTHPDDLDADLRLVDDVRQGRRDTYRLLKRFLRPDGTVVWGDLSVSCLRTPTGLVASFVSQVVDVTDREAAMAALAESERSMRLERDRSAATLASMLEPHVLFTAVRDDTGGVVDLVVRSVNAAACGYLRRTDAQLLGRTLLEALEGEGASRVFTWCRQVLDTGRSVSLDDVDLMSSVDGTRRWLDVRAVHVGDDVSFAWRDVTERHEAAEALRQREAAYRLLADNATDVVLRSARGGGIEWVSPSITEILGWTPEQVIGLRVSDLMHPEDLAKVRDTQRAIMAEGGTEGRTVARFATADGDWRWMSDHGRAIVDDAGSIAGGIDALRDVQTEHDATEALAEREQRFRGISERAAQAERELRGVIDSLLDPWVLLAAIRDADDVIVDFRYADANDAACAADHLPRESLIGSRLLDLFPEHGPSGLFDRYAAVVETGVSLALDDEPFTDAWSGVQRRFDNRAVKVGDGISFTWRDATDRYHLRQLLRQQADEDLLTGVANRRLLTRRLDELVSREPRTGSRLAVLFCDLDDFKDINDELGHAAGDAVLARVATAIRGVIREQDLVARVGGDEFVIILDGVRSSSDAESVAEKVACAVRSPFDLEGRRVTPRTSIGVALADRGESSEHVLARADTALYAAKRSGRDRVIVASAAQEGAPP